MAILKFLINNESTVTDINIYKKSIFWKAIYYENIEKLKSLLERGFDYNIADSDGITPLRWAAIQDNIDIFKAIKAAEYADKILALVSKREREFERNLNIEMDNLELIVKRIGYLSEIKGYSYADLEDAPDIIGMLMASYLDH